MAADLALLGMMYAMRGGLVGILACAVDEDCRDMKALMRKLGSRGLNLITWTAEELERALFSTYPHQPTPVDPGLLVLSMGLSNTPILGDLYDLYTGVTGYDPITGQYLAGWERLANVAGALPFLGVSGANIRHGVDAVESLIDSGDELAQFIGAAGKSCRRNSFSEETPVATDEGAVPIGEIDVGDQVLAWNEFTDTTGYYTVSATFSHVDATIVELTIDDETLETTADHPFYVVDDAPWLAVGETQGRWVEAGELQAGDEVQKADGTTGVVATMKIVAQPQRMYNLTVADAHTFFVGDGEWLVHNATICNWLGGGLTDDKLANDLVREAQAYLNSLPKGSRRTVVAVAQRGNRKIVTAWVGTKYEALEQLDTIATARGAEFVWPSGTWNDTGHAEQVAYRAFQAYDDLKIGISRKLGPCEEKCQPFFDGLNFIHVYWPE